MLNKDDFLTVVKNTPLVAIDLVLPDAKNAIVVGKRLNEPAAGFWFVPGGRILKDEFLEQAFRRLTLAELGTSYEMDQAQLLGAFTHQYPTNFAKMPGITTHYVVLAYRLDAALDLSHLPLNQHSEYRRVCEEDDLSQVHPNSTAYLPYLL